jgi:hypothetical protein
MILPAGLARGYAANEKLNPGIIGLAGIGGVNAKAFRSLGENIAALYDVDPACWTSAGSNTRRRGNTPISGRCSRRRNSTA